MPTTRKRLFKSGNIQAPNANDARYFALRQVIPTTFAGASIDDITVIKIETHPLPRMPKLGGDRGEVYGYRVIIEGPADKVRNVRNDRVGLSAEWKKYLHPEEEE